jgi:hypothetical protein
LGCQLISFFKSDVIPADLFIFIFIFSGEKLETGDAMMNGTKMEELALLDKPCWSLRASLRLNQLRLSLPLSLRACLILHLTQLLELRPLLRTIEL